MTNQSESYKKAKDKDDSIFKEIKEKFKSEGYPVKDSFMQGSFKVDTAIKSLDGDFDVDRAIIINDSEAPDDPVVPKKAILSVLEARNFQDPKVKKPCVTADYKSVNLHIDYTVYKKDDNGDYHLAVGKVGSDGNNKEWSSSDPEGLISWIDSHDQYGEKSLEKRKQLKRLIRYLKRWRDVHFSDEATRKKVFSIGLTVMVKQEYSPSIFSSDLNDDLIELKSVVDSVISGDYIKEQAKLEDYRIHVNLPVNPHRDIFQHKIDGGGSQGGSDLNVGRQFWKKLLKLKEKLQKAIDESDEIKQCTILNKVFGSDFEIPQKSTSNKKAKAAVSAPLFATAGASGTSQGA